MTQFNAALLQVNAQNDMAQNREAAEALVDQAAEQGGELIVLPENCALMAGSREELFQNAHKVEAHPMVITMQERAARHGRWIVIGSIATPAEESAKLLNTCVVVDASGAVAATYHKIHLYDVEVKGGESHRESRNYQAGDRLVSVPTPFGKIGLTICYDLRFPQLYRKLAQSGCDILLVPAAFTAYTGALHWEVLLRARAIETGTFMLAPAQVGRHPANRATYGHSLAVDPWGRVIADGGEAVGVTMVEIDTSLVREYREAIPSLTLERSFQSEE